MARQRSIFDIVGPVMIGPSSSHTAGAVRLGSLARAVFGHEISAANIGLHGSFASTGSGHGTDLALVAGLLGMAPDDARIRDSLTLARESGLDVTFEVVDLGEAHPNTACLTLSAPGGSTMKVRGSSLGGGDVMVTRIDDYDVEITGDLPVLAVAHIDRPGKIAAVSSILAEAGVNIASMTVSRERRGAGALMLIETDVEVDAVTVALVAESDGVLDVRAVPAV